MAQHRHTPSSDRPAQRVTIVTERGGRVADETAQLQLVCDATRARQVRRNVLVIDPLHCQRTFALSGADAIAYERSAG
jgi:hypothetical protein